VADESATVTWRALERETEARLRAAGVDDAAREARWLIEEVSGYEGAEAVLAHDQPATELGVARLDQLVERRGAGEPLQYVLGRWAFRALDLFVDRRALIPRPETEVVVDHALVEIDRLAPDRPAVVVDLGTGTGAIALSIAAERPRAEVWATDASTDALAVARANLAGLGRPAERVRLVEGWWYDALPDELAGTVDVVVSNPPYVAADEVLPPEVLDWEPSDALVAGPSGLEAVEVILDRAAHWLAPRGSVVIELAPPQGDAAIDRAAHAGLDAVVHPDLAGRSRVLVARRRS
jgi:release factor glutamine methyltransferase